MKTGNKIYITQYRGLAGKNQKQIGTVRALGLKRRHHTVEHFNTPQIQGMIKSVKFMVKIENAL
jgi:large subunit ribosomal protein L30